MMTEEEIKSFVKSTEFYKKGNRFTISEIKGRLSHLVAGGDVETAELSRVLKEMVYEGDLSPCERGTGYMPASRNRYWLTRSWKGGVNCEAEAIQ